jgi:hypothetical protein
MRCKYLILNVLFLLLSSSQLFSQSSTSEPIGVMTSNGKIYVVVAVVVTILLGMFIYLFSLDRKINKLEKN